MARIALMVLAGLALVPSVLPFTPANRDENRVCVALVEGWHGDRRAPAEADFELLAEAVADLPTPEMLQDQAARAAFRVRERERQASPPYQRVQSYILWAAGDGACISESRHRLIQSGLLLGAVAVVGVMGRAVARHRRRFPAGHLA